MTTRFTRRSTLASLLAGTALLSTGVTRATFAAGAAANKSNEARLVFIILRGGMDGLSAVPAYGDPDFANARDALAIPPPGANGGTLDLDGFFGLNPRLTQLHGLYGAGELLVVQAVCSPYRSRSHFDGQNVLECGAPVPFGLDSGWLNRALEPLSAKGPRGIAISSAVPLALRGNVPVMSWAPSRLPAPQEDLIARVASLYAHDERLANAFAEAQAARGVMGTGIAVRAGAAGAGAGGGSAGGGGEKDGRGGAAIEMMRAAGKFLARDDGPRVAMLEASGWDSHATQAQPAGALYRNLSALDAGMDELRNALGTTWRNTVVVIATEFGRTVAMNGTSGTDHGSGGAMFLAGGAVQGKRVLTDWPGLSVANRYEGRDLRATTDMRAVLKGVLHDHFQIADGHLEARVFPDSRSAKRIEGLVRAPLAGA